MKAALALLLLAVLPALAFAQGTKADYERADKLAERTRGTVFRAKIDPHWLPGNERFWYRNDLADGKREFVLVDAVRATRASAFDHARLAAALSKTLARPVEADRLPIAWLRFETNGDLVFGAAGKSWRGDLQTYELREATGVESPTRSLPAHAQARPSRRTGEETTLTFVNQTGGDAALYWLDTAGERHPYAIIPPGGSREMHTFGGHVWQVETMDGKPLGVFEATDEPATAIIDGKIAAAPPVEKDEGGVRSPDGKWVAFVQNNNLWLRPVTGSGLPFALSQDGKATDSYDRDTVFWSPDSRKIAALRTEPGEEHTLYLVEQAPKDQLQPRLHTRDYAKPGDRVPRPRPQLFDIATRKQTSVAETLFPNPWSLGDVRWADDSRRFTFVYNQRGHQALRVIAVDAETGAVTTLVNETSDTFIDYSSKQFVRFLDDTHELIWMSERDGWNHLYLYDARAEVVKNQITKGGWVVRGVDRVDEAKRQLYFRAGGIVPGQDPYYVHFCRVNFDGTGLIVFTPGDGTHVLTYSPDGRFFIDTFSRVDLPPITELRSADDGKLVLDLERADVSALQATRWQTPERFFAKGRDGKTDIFGVIWRPTNFDPAARKYPVIEQIYAGPQSAFVPKAFSAFYGNPQQIAELGFVVVQIDGMGTNWRSRAFHDVCWKNLADAGLPDRIAWIRAAGQKYPSLDLSRVGIYGGSAGGQSALGALLFHGDFYKAAIADCGCHDNRVDKQWWNEQWMGWPVGPQYEKNSNATNAGNLSGKLLLVVGGMDDNVDPACTFQVVQALSDADKDFDLLVLPRSGHGAAESPYGKRRRMDFFVRHLLGVEPRTR